MTFNATMTVLPHCNMSVKDPAVYLYATIIKQTPEEHETKVYYTPEGTKIRHGIYIIPS